MCAQRLECHRVASATRSRRAHAGGDSLQRRRVANCASRAAADLGKGTRHQSRKLCQKTHRHQHPGQAAVRAAKGTSRVAEQADAVPIVCRREPQPRRDSRAGMRCVAPQVGSHGAGRKCQKRFSASPVRTLL